jgi:KaiC/GvpD/RAD55 family RecA-like ATPase
MNEYDEEYDIVIATLQEKRDRLWKMTQSNMNMDMMNIMDDIRLAQIDQLDHAIASWKKSKE